MVHTRSGPVQTPRFTKRNEPPGSMHRTGTRSLSRVTEDDADDNTHEPPSRIAMSIRSNSVLPRRAQRRSKSTTAMTATDVGAGDESPRVKRTRLRPSLAGPQVHEMDVGMRAQVLIPIAEDCIIQLLKAGLNGSIYRPGDNQSWRSAWDSLQSKCHVCSIWIEIWADEQSNVGTSFSRPTLCPSTISRMSERRLM
jgi:hypothetical protein